MVHWREVNIHFIGFEDFPQKGFEGMIFTILLAIKSIALQEFSSTSAKV